MWEEAGIFPYVSFEVLSPKNSAEGVWKKWMFCRHFGGEEYDILNPDAETLVGRLRRGNRFAPFPELSGFVSPPLGIRFETAHRVVRMARAGLARRDIPAVRRKTVTRGLNTFSDGVLSDPAKGRPLPGRIGRQRPAMGDRRPRRVGVWQGWEKGSGRRPRAAEAGRGPPPDGAGAAATPGVKGHEEALAVLGSKRHE